MPGKATLYSDTGADAVSRRITREMTLVYEVEQGYSTPRLKVSTLLSLDKKRLRVIVEKRNDLGTDYETVSDVWLDLGETMKKTATFVKQMQDWKGDARLYRVDPPMPRYDNKGKTRYVIVSATTVPYSGPETFIFACDDQGDNINFRELPGSFRGGLDHVEALQGAGYEIAEG